MATAESAHARHREHFAKWASARSCSREVASPSSAAEIARLARLHLTRMSDFTHTESYGLPCWFLRIVSPLPVNLAPHADDSDPLAAYARSALVDASAADSLVRATQPDVLRLCRALTDAQMAEDVAQEAFLRVFSALPGFRYETSVRIWILAIARRTAMDHLRRVVRRRRLTTLLRATHVEHHVSHDSSVETDDLLLRLSPDRRAAFVLTQMLGLTYEEAAEVSGCPIGTIRSRVARARADLVELVRDQR